MDYGQILPSAIPHIINIQESFSIPFDKYLFSLLVEIIFTLLVIPFLVFSIYYVVKNVDKHKLDNTQDTTAKVQEFKKTHDDGLSIDQNIFSLRTIKKPEKKKAMSPSQKNTLFIVELDRKINYFTIFLIINVISINAFDGSYIVLGLLGLQIVSYLALNICSYCAKWKILKICYVLPTLATLVPYAIGTHSLTLLDY